MLSEVTIGGAFLAGLISFLSPCVLPLVPPYLCFITGTSLEDLVDNKMRPKEERRQVMLSALMFVFGFSTVFVILGATAGYYETKRGIGTLVSGFIMRSSDVLQAFPVFVFAIAVVATWALLARELRLSLN